MAAVRKSPEDQPSDATAARKSFRDQPPDAAGGGPPEDRPPEASKVTSYVQVAFQAVITVGSLAIAAIKRGTGLATLTVIAITSLLLFFANLKLIPKREIAPLISKIFNGMVWIIVLGIFVYALVPALLPLVAKPPVPTPTPTSAVNTLRELAKELNKLRAQYQSLPSFGGREVEVNRDATVLARKINELNDGDLGLSMQIFKYETLAYANGIVAGSEMIASKQFPDEDKLNSIKSLLDASEKAQKLIEVVRSPQPVDDKLQKTRDWLITDDADPRLQRFTAVGLCFRWRVSRNPKDLTEARNIANSLPAYYKAREHPGQFYELAECLKDN